MTNWSDCAKYYNTPFVKSCILRQYANSQGHVNREAGVIGVNTVRFMHLSSWNSIQYLYGKFIMPEHYNLYQSIVLVNMPKVPSTRTERDAAQEEFRQNFRKYWYGSDLNIDVDADDMNLAMKVTSKVKAVLDQFKMPYSLKNSGVKGFHITVPWEQWQKTVKNPYKLFASCQTIAQNLAKHANVPFGENGLDKFIYRNPRRLWKTPYSIDSRSMRVCLPLTDNQFNNFSMDIVSPEHVLQHIKLITGKDDQNRPMNRDLLVRNTGCKPKVIKDFLEEFLPKGLEGSKYKGRTTKEKELDYKTGVFK